MRGGRRTAAQFPVLGLQGRRGPARSLLPPHTRDGRADPAQLQWVRAYQYPEKLVSLAITRLLDGGRVPLYGDGRHVREWVHVDDLCDAVHRVLVAGRAGRVYNVGGTAMTNGEMVDLLLAACGRGRDQVDHVGDRSGHDRRYSVDWRRIRAELGFAPSVEVGDGIAATVDWYRDNPAWWRPLTSVQTTGR
nr:NAD-dependent epimerase/dehydratase family protein [Nocardiopsis sp. CNR-923]